MNISFRRPFFPFQVSDQLSAAIGSGAEIDLINAYDSATDVVKEAEKVT